MFTHLTDPAVLTGLGMVTIGGLLHAAMLSLIDNAASATPRGTSVAGAVGAAGGSLTVGRDDVTHEPPSLPDR